MQETLFEAKWWMILLPLAAGAIVWFQGNNRQEKRATRAGLVIVLLGIVWSMVSYFVVTDRERVVKQMYVLAKSVDQKDWTTFASLIDTNTTFFTYENRDQLIEGAKQTAERIGLKNVMVTSLDARKSGTRITVDLSALSQQDITMGRPMPTNWEFEWQNFGSGWKMSRIVARGNSTISADAINSRLIKP